MQLTSTSLFKTTSMQIAPTMDEAKALKMYRGPPSDLSPPEQFLLAMSGVPRLVNKASRGFV